MPAQEHCDRLVAARLQADIMGTSTLVVARTDAEAATYLTSNIDHRDHGYILGASVPMDSTLNAATMSARAAGQADIEAVEAQWMATAKLDTFPKLVAKAVGDDAAKVRATPPAPCPLTRPMPHTSSQRPEHLVHVSRSTHPGLPFARPFLPPIAMLNPQAAEWADFTSFDNSPSLDAMRSKAGALLGDANVPFFDWESPRAREGYYRLDKGVDLCVARAKAYAPHADLIWMETAKPILAQAQEFAAEVHKAYPGKLLAYNLSPSFNWDGGVFDNDTQIEAFTGDLGKAGFVWQFITLAGFHSNGLMTHNFVQEYAKRGSMHAAGEIELGTHE